MSRALRVAWEQLAGRLTPAARKLVVAGDGQIASVELSRQILARMPGVRSLQMGIGVEFYQGTSAAQVDCTAGHVLVRTGEIGAHAYLQRLVAIGMPYAYVIDDNFWMLLDEQTPLHRFYQHPLVRRTLEYGLANADVVLCHSEHFRNFLLAFNPNVAVVPTTFDFSVLDGVPRPPVPDEVRIGVVANTSRSADLALIVDAVRDVLRQRPGVVFEFFGYTPPELEGMPGVRSLPHRGDYADFIRTKVSRGWLLGLAPLTPNRFAEYKTNNKLREFGACSIAVIYSDAPIYTECVQDGVNGWIVPNDTPSWTRAILAAVDDPMRTREVGRRAREYVERHHQPEWVAQSWLRALEPTFVRRLGALASLRDRQAVVARWEKAPSDGPLIVNSYGQLKEDDAGEAAGFRRRDVVLLVEPGETVWTEPLAPLAGHYHWGMLLATFARQLTGTITVRIHEGSRLLAEQVHDMAGLPDGSIVDMRCDVPPSRAVRITVESGASGSFGLYGVSAKAKTHYIEGPQTYPLGFAA